MTSLLSIAGMPGMDLAVQAAADLAKTVQNIKVYKKQCVDLSHRCTMLSLALRDGCQGLEGSELMSAADEVNNIIERAHKKAQLWASWNWYKCLVNQGDIKNGMDKLDKDIEHCIAHFGIKAQTELHRNQREQNRAYERETAMNRELLLYLLHDVGSIRDIIINEPNAVQPIMEIIQKELQNETMRPEQSLELQHGLYEIHRETKELPPMIDLTGQVQRTSKNPAAYGAYNDVYTGLWLGEEKVALKFARAMNHTHKARKRFHKEVEIWRDLQHPHVSRLYGIFYIEEQIYSVSPWMDRGSALDYINSTDEIINRLIILGDAASGMEYLHYRGVVHGDLRAANILIGDDGRACVSDFGLSQMIEEVAPDMPSSIHGDSPVRWQAPELLVDEDGPISVSKSSDVWSFGMLCLEIMSGKKPYHYRVRDGNVITDIVVDRRLPDRPTDEAVVTRGLGDELWNLMLHCWNWSPLERPPMGTVKVCLRSLPSLPSTQGQPSPSPILAGKALAESPKPLMKDLPQVPNRTAPISLPSRTSLSPGNGGTYRTPPSPSLLSSTSPASSSLPGTNALSASIPAIRRHTPNPGSSGGSFSINNATMSSASGSGIRHRLSTSSGSDQIGQSSTRNLPMTTGTLGTTPPKSPLLFQGPSGSNGSSSSSMRYPSTSRRESRSASTSTTHSNEVALSLSGLSLASPSASDLMNSPPRNRTAPLSGLSLTSPSRMRTSQDAPLRVNVEGPDDGPLLTSLSLSGIFPVGRMPSVSEHTEGRPPSSDGAGALTSPPLRTSEDRSEGGQSGSISSSFPSSLDIPFINNRSSSISDACPPRNGLLDFRSLDLLICIQRNEDGSMKAATLAGLIEYLLKDTVNGVNYARDQKIRDTFLVSHRLFTSTTEVLKHLLYRFNMASADQSMRVEERVATRFNVLRTLTQWLKEHHAKALQLHHLEELHLFLQDIVSPPAFFNNAQDMIKVIDTLIAGRGSPVSPTLSHTGSRRSSRASDITPVDLAVALSILEGGKYQAITPTDCVSYLLHKDDYSESGRTNKVAEARATNNKIVTWVKSSILRPKDIATRGQTLRFFINTAAECQKLHNYSSVSALLAGIQSPAISELKRTIGYPYLDKNMFETRRRLSALLDIGHNHKAYREALPEPGKVTCLPYLAVHLKDLQVVFERHPTNVPYGEQTLINFEKFGHVYDSILSVLAFQARPFIGPSIGTSGPTTGALVYLEEQLATTAVGPAAESKLEARSIDRQKQEQADYVNRIQERRALGFSTNSRGRR